MNDEKDSIGPETPAPNSSPEPVAKLATTPSAQNPLATDAVPTRRLDFSRGIAKGEGSSTAGGLGPVDGQSLGGEGVRRTQRLDFSGGGSVTGDDTKNPGRLNSTESQADLSHMSIEELQSRREKLERKILDRQKTDMMLAIGQIAKLLALNHIPLEDLVWHLGGLPAKHKAGAAVQRYRDPQTGSTWSGRGREPLWIRGKDRTKFLIDQ